jgi:hypothetical protein
LPVVSLLAAAALVALGAVRAPADSAAEIATRLRDRIKYLASDELEGRGVGTAGLNKAADFIRDGFQAAGLDVSRVDGGAYQSFRMSAKAELGTPNSLSFVGPDGKAIELKPDVDFRPCSFGGGGKIEGDLVFAGYAIDSKQNHWDDLAGLDLKGKVALVIRRVPAQANPHGPFAGPHGDVGRDGELLVKLGNVVAAGASALLIVNDPYSIRKAAREGHEMTAKLGARVIEAAEAFDAADPKDAEAAAKARKALSEAVDQLKKGRGASKTRDADALMAFGYGGNGKDGSIPVAQITIAACDRLLKPALGKSLEQLESEIDKAMKPHSAPIEGWKANGITTVRRTATDVKNVIGVLEGEGPLADETIVIGAHYDHLGRGGAGSLLPGSHEIHNGADDNASGSVGLLDLAQRFGRRSKKLPRRLVFIAFTGEEAGLVGSARYVKEPVFPLDKTVAMINLDMVGRLSHDKLTVFGTGTSDVWTKLLEPACKAQGLQLVAKPEGFGPSDHSSFYAKKIPVLHFFTGTHGDYHRPTDDWEKINVPGMSRVIDVIEAVVTATAEAGSRPAYVEVKGGPPAPRGGSRPYFGSIPDFSSEESGYSISGVAPGSPAEKGGVKGGDRIVEFGGRKITGLDDFDLALRKFSGGDEVPITVIRAGKSVPLKVVLDRPK